MLCLQEHGEEQDCADYVLTPRRALDEAFEELDNGGDHDEEGAMTGESNTQCLTA